jgi:septum formation protein
MSGNLKLRAPFGAAFILASASPRRLDLLARIGLVPDQVLPADIDETPLPRELPRDYAKRMAAGKLAAIAPSHPDAYILAADTVVACGRRILPKAESEDEARKCLKLLSGQRHRVLGAIAISAPGSELQQRVVSTSVTFKRLSKPENEAYIASGEWRGKAGGYAIQGLAAAYIRFLSGSHANVVGLPLHETHTLLSGLGFKHQIGDG